MIVKFEISLKDLVAFNRYHCANSPTIKRRKLFCMLLVPGLLIAAALFISPTEEVGRPVIVAGAVVLSVLYAVAFNYTFAASMDRNVRLLYKEGTNKGTIGQHELEIDDRGLVERTEAGESRVIWRAVERIAETEEYAFIYLSSVTAHVIPKQAVTGGDANAFIARARQLWVAASPDAEAR
jgi:YcxB-like protein